MVVIAIIGVLAAILIPLMNNFLQNARISSANSTAASARNNLKYFLSDEQLANRGMRGGTTQVLVFTVDNNGMYILRTPLTAANWSGNYGTMAVANNPGNNLYIPQSRDRAGLDAAGVNPTTAGNAILIARDMMQANLEAILPDARNCSFVIILFDNDATHGMYLPSEPRVDTMPDGRRYVRHDWNGATAAAADQPFGNIERGRMLVGAGFDQRGEVIGTAPAESYAGGATWGAAGAIIP
jgi:type II secretory pathway pseudopilin PulG